MQKTKDPLFTPVLPRLKMKYNRRTPNILRRPPTTKPVSHSLTVPLRQSTFILTQILPNPAPVVKHLNPIRNEDIEVIFLDSDGSDIETDDESLTVISDTDVDERSMTEIVVKENQIFQLQDQASTRTEAPTSSHIVDSLQQVQMKGTLQTICQNKTIQPVYNIDDDEQPVVTRIEDETVATLEETLPPVENVSTINVNDEQSVETNVISEVEEFPFREPTIEISICRTCLKPIPPCTCHKLFDTENQRECHELRQKLFELIESIDFQASLNPVVCSGCFEAIHTAHSFRKRVKDVEEQISKRKKGIAPIDLKDMLEEVAQEKLGKIREYKKKKTSKIAQDNLEQYLEKRKQIIDKYISSLRNNDPSPKAKPTKGFGISNTPSSTKKIPVKKPASNTCPSALESRNGQPSMTILQNILLNNSQNGNCIIEIVAEDQQQENTLSVPNLESTTPNIESTVPNLKSTASHPKSVVIKKSTVPNLESSVPNLESSVPNLESSVPNLKSTAPNLESTASHLKSTVVTKKSAVPNLKSSAITIKPTTIPNLESSRPLVSILKSKVPNLKSYPTKVKSTVPNLESSTTFVSVLKSSNVKSTTGSSIPILDCAIPVIERSTVIVEGAASVTNPDLPIIDLNPIQSIDLTAPAYTIPRVQKNVAPFKKIKQSSGSSLDDFLARRKEACKRMLNMEERESFEEQRKRKAEGAYNYLFNANVIKKKKPKVPKSFDLFDEEHDKYFNDLEGEAGCFMVRKWKRFGNGQKGFGEGPFLCEDCGKIFTKRMKFKQHLDHHMGRDMTICSYCGIKVKTCRLKAHVTWHKPPCHECKDCGKKFHLKNLLETHVSLIHKHPNRRYQCQVCGVLLRKNSLVMHMRKHNSSGAEISCELCRKVFENQGSCNHHRRTHTSKAKIYTCNICSKPIKSRFNLNNHMRAFHEGGQTKACNICGKVLSKRQSLVRHMQISHRLKPKVSRRKANRKPSKQMSEQEETKEATKFISSDTDEDRLKVVTEEVIYENIVEAPMGLQEIEVPYKQMF